MPTQEIPRADWKTFLNVFSRQHEGWLSTLELLGSDIGAQREARDLPLEGISVTDDDAQEIAISLGNITTDHVTHTVLQPTRIWVEQTSEGANASLEIESSENVKALLRFRSPMPAEMVDGVILEHSD